MNQTPPKRSLSRRLSLAALSSAVIAGAWTVPATAATATPLQVLVYNDPLYVDAGTQADVDGGETGHEGINMQLALKAAGNTVSTVDTTTAAAFSAALVGKQVFVIPETEEAGLGPALDADTIKVVRDWVTAGGTLIAGDDYSDNLNALFGFSIQFAANDPADDAWELHAASGTPFSGGPASLAANNGSDYFETSSLPAGAVPVYSDTDSGSSIVFDVPYGAGEVISLGWDWYNAAPASPLGQDGGWNDVLQRAVLTGTPPAPPVVKDTTAPSTTITSVEAKRIKISKPGQKMAKRAKVTVSFTSTETSTFTCSVDGSAYKACSSPFTVKLKKGKHTIGVTSTDAAGNTDATPATTTVKIKKAKKAKKK